MRSRRSILCSGTVRSAICILGILSCGLPSRVAAQALRESAANCYALTWQPFRLSDGSAPAGWQPADIERGVWLTPIELAGADDSNAWFVVRPAPGFAAGGFGSIRWHWDSALRLIVVEWSSGLSGIRLELSPQPEVADLMPRMSGRATWWADTVVPVGLEAKVEATLITCTAP